MTFFLSRPAQGYDTNIFESWKRASSLKTSVKMRGRPGIQFSWGSSMIVLSRTVCLTLLPAADHANFAEDPGMLQQCRDGDQLTNRLNVELCQAQLL